MRRILAVIPLVVVVAFAVVADNPAVGTWQCTFSIRDADDMPCTLTFKEEAGKLTGAILGGVHEIPLTDIKQDGDIVSFKFAGMGDECSVKVKIDGRKLDGKWNSGGQEGAFKGEKKS